MPKSKLLLDHDSATVLLGVSFIMCMNIFLFLFELSNYVTPFVAGTTIVSLKYIGNKTTMIFTRYTTLFFHIPFFIFFCYIYQMPTFQKPSFSVMILKLILDLSIDANLSCFISGIQMACWLVTVKSFTQFKRFLSQIYILYIRNVS